MNPSDCTLLSCSQRFRPTLRHGQVLKRRLQADTQQSYYLYLPRSSAPPTRLMVCVHGISRNARRQIRLFADYAEQHGVALVAPLFDKHRFPGYQRLGLSGLRADLILQQILDELHQLTDIAQQPLYLFGYSGGGQFVHRYAMAYPQQVAAMVIGAAGWYTLPDSQQRFPYGCGSHHKLPGLRFQPHQFLRIPACVMVGAADNQPDAALRQSEWLTLHQGRSRLERGQRWIRCMQQAATTHGLSTRYQFITLPTADHSFTRSVAQGNMASQVFTFLFTPNASQQAA